MRELRLADHVLRDAADIEGGTDVLDAEHWASVWLGVAWVDAAITEREPEGMLCAEVAGRASAAPSERAVAAVAALRRVAPPSEHAMLDGTIGILAATQPLPEWIDAPASTPVAAWRTVDVWGSVRLLFVEFDGPQPHTVMASVTEVGGLLVDTIALLQPGAATAWEDMREPDEVPMPLSERPVDEVLADLADALRSTDMYWPRHDDEYFVDLRALAWARCRGWLPERPDFEPITDEERRRLVEGFVAGSGLPDDDVTRSLADVFVDFGEGYMSTPLGWSPGWVEWFLLDWLPRKVALDAAQRVALPEVLRRWVRYALERRGVDPAWIAPVVDTVDECLPEFELAFDDESEWGPAKQVAAALAERGIDLTDRDAVASAIRELNAENLARRLLDD